MMADNETVPMPTSFFRIEVLWYRDEKRPRLGLLRSAGYVLKEKELSEDDEHTLRELLHWFNRYLTAPRNLRRVAAVFWYRPEIVGTTELWSKMIETGKLLQRYGYRAEIVTTTRPGKIVYRDTTQIAAVPFNDTFEVDGFSARNVCG